MMIRQKYIVSLFEIAGKTNALLVGVGDKSNFSTMIIFCKF